MTQRVQKTFGAYHENFSADRKCKQLSRVKIDARSVKDNLCESASFNNDLHFVQRIFFRKSVILDREDKAFALCLAQPLRCYIAWSYH